MSLPYRLIRHATLLPLLLFAAGCTTPSWHELPPAEINSWDVVKDAETAARIGNEKCPSKDRPFTAWNVLGLRGEIWVLWSNPDGQYRGAYIWKRTGELFDCHRGSMPEI